MTPERSAQPTILHIRRQRSRRSRPNYSLSVSLLCYTTCAFFLTNPSSTHVFWTAEATQQLQPQQVGELLIRRLAFVKAGKRLPYIARHMRKTSSSIQSDEESQTTTSIEEQLEGSFPFLSNLDSLGFVDEPAIDDTKVPDPSFLQLLRRSIVLFWHFLPVLLTLILAIVIPRFRQHVWYPWLANCCGRAGPTFIKWAQWGSIRTDIFPEKLCTHLSRLHNAAPVTDPRTAATRVAKALGVGKGSALTSTVFSDFQATPVASGSIAQIHRATLFNGEQVAIKLRHPNTARLLHWDAILLTAAARFIPFRGASETVQQFGATLAQQADLRVEAQNLEHLNTNFRSWPRVRFPTPIFGASDCIVETWELGKIASHQMEGAPLSLAQFMVTTGVGLYLKMLLLDNLMHADLHPGNILVHEETNQSGKQVQSRRICLVDAGMVARLTPRDSNIFVGLLCSLGQGDGAAAAACVWQFSSPEKNPKLDDAAQKQQNEEKFAAFRDAMQELFAERCQGYGTNVDAGYVLRGVLELLRVHWVAVDANFATLVINILCLDGLAKKACPTYNILDASRPLLEGWKTMKRNDENDTTPSKWRLQIRYWQKQWSDRQFFLTEGKQRHLVAQLTGDANANKQLEK